MMRVGFTGTRRGMTPAQQEALEQYMLGVASVDPECVLLHGDCVGADAEAFALARRLGWATEAYPGDIPHLCAGTTSTVVHAPAPTLARNHVIVRSCDFLVAAPHTGAEELRSGTWATVRYARGMARRCVIIWPDGSLAWGSAS